MKSWNPVSILTIWMNQNWSYGGNFEHVVFLSSGVNIVCGAPRPGQGCLLSNCGKEGGLSRRCFGCDGCCWWKLVVTINDNCSIKIEPGEALQCISRAHVVLCAVKRIRFGVECKNTSIWSGSKWSFTTEWEIRLLGIFRRRQLSPGVKPAGFGSISAAWRAVFLWLADGM